MRAGRVILTTQRDAHAAALLPVLRWLERAGLSVVARSPGLLRRRGALDAIAHALELPAPALDWQRRVRVEATDLLLGTTDDLDLLQHVRNQTSARFLAVARLPLPATLLSAPPPRLLGPTLDEHARTPAGRMLASEGDDVLPALARRTRGLPFLLTGCPEVALPGPAAPADRFVLLLPGDLPLEGTTAEDGALLVERLLQRLLTPLSAAGIGVEIAVPFGAEPPQDARTLAPLVVEVGRSLSFDDGALTVVERASPTRLSAASAVLALRERDLLAALVGGAERCWLLSFALGPDPFERQSDLALDWVIPTVTALGEWVAAEGWNTPPSAAKRITTTLAPLTTRRTPEQLAQAILSIAAERH